ncbi:MAG: hypothetical protein EPN17_09280 [Methylobacter sp.]|nr:MAG: hypothetical protein EPN17_09280 [Methylobacter sp.]
MNVTPTSSAINLINTAQHKSADAAQVIAKLPMQNNEVGSAEFNSNDIIKPVLSLKEAELETSAAVKLLEADKKTTGSLLDIKT